MGMESWSKFLTVSTRLSHWPGDRSTCRLEVPKIECQSLDLHLKGPFRLKRGETFWGGSTLPKSNPI